MFEELNQWFCEDNSVISIDCTKGWLNFCRTQWAIHLRGATASPVPPCSPVCQPTEDCHLRLLVSDYHSVCQPIQRTEVLHFSLSHIFRFLCGTGGSCHGRVDEQLDWQLSKLHPAGNCLCCFGFSCFSCLFPPWNACTQQLLVMSQYSLMRQLG